MADNDSMGNNTFYDMIDKRITRLEDKVSENIQKLSEKVDRLVSERNAVCKDHDNRIDNNEQYIAILRDRHEQHEKKQNLTLVAIGIAVTAMLGIIGFILQKVKF